MKWTTDFSFTSSDVTAYRNKFSLGGMTIKESGLETTIFKTGLSEKMNMALKWGNIGDPRKVSHAMQFSNYFPKLEGNGALKITQTLEVRYDRIAAGTGVAVVGGVAYVGAPYLAGILAAGGRNVLNPIFD